MAKPPARTSSSTTRRMDLFGPPALLESEDATTYDRLLAEISGAVSPADILEEIWVRDIVDLNWDIARLRRLKSQLLIANLPRGLRVVLDSMCGYREAEELSTEWAKRNPQAVKEVDDLLAAARLTMNEVMAETLAVKISDFERIDRLIMSAEARRNSVLREIDRHRASRKEAQPPRTGDAEDAQFIEIEPAVRYPKNHAQRT